MKYLSILRVRDVYGNDHIVGIVDTTIPEDVHAQRAIVQLYCAIECSFAHLLYFVRIDNNSKPGTVFHYNPAGMY